MNKRQYSESLRSEVISIAITFAYENIPDIKERGVVVNARDCNAKRIVRRQKAVGPGEAIDTLLQDEEWEVSIALKVFSSVLIISIYRYNDGSLDIVNFQTQPL